jgi:hypothetical protein
MLIRKLLPAALHRADFDVARNILKIEEQTSDHRRHSQTAEKLPGIHKSLLDDMSTLLASVLQRAFAIAS